MIFPRSVAYLRSSQCEIWGSSPNSPTFVDSHDERGGGPSGPHGGNPLVVTVRETTFEVDLKFCGPARHMPRAIRSLCRQQEFDAFPIQIMVGLNDSGIGQRP